MGSNIEDIKQNTANGKQWSECGYDNFIDIAAHVAVKMLLQTCRHGAIDKKEAHEEFLEFVKIYENTKRAYDKEAKLYRDTATVLKDTAPTVNQLSWQNSEHEALSSAIDVLRQIFNDKTIGIKFKE